MDSEQKKFLTHILKAANFIKRLNTCENTNKLNYMAVDGVLLKSVTIIKLSQQNKKSLCL